MFDTNYFLARILPLNIWSEIVEESIREVETLFNQQKIELVICTRITDEIATIIKDLTNLLNRAFSHLSKSFKNKKKAFDQKDLDKLRYEFDKLIANESDLKKKNQLFHFESLLLQEIKNDRTKTINEILLTCLLFVNNFNFQMIGEVADFITTYKMKGIDPKQKDLQKWQTIKTTVDNSIKNPTDAEILTTLVYYLEKQQQKGLFVTHDFKDFLINSIALEGPYPNLKVIRPAYLSYYV